MSIADLEKTIDDAFEARDGINTATTGAVRDAVERSLEPARFRQGARVAEKGG